MSAAACPYDECDGNGAISYVHESDDPPREIAPGVLVGPAITHGQNLCKCRRGLAPRPGEARWWTSKRIYSDEWESLVYQHSCEITVDAELPVSADNYVVEKRGNRYYPTTIDLDFDLSWAHSLFPDEARQLAAKLIEAADAASAYDEPDANEDGTWWSPPQTTPVIEDES